MTIKLLYVTDGIAPYVVGGMQAVSRRHIRCLADSDIELVIIFSHVDRLEKIDLPGKNIYIEWPHSRGFMKYVPGHYVQELKDYSKKVTQILNNEKPDIVYTEGPLLYDYLQNYSQRILVLFHPHGLEMFQYKGSFLEDLRGMPLRNIIKTHCNRSDYVISFGGQITDILKSRIGLSGQRIKNLPNSIEYDVSSQEDKPINRHESFIFVGRNEKRKGLPLLLDIVKCQKMFSLNVVGLFSTGRQNKLKNVKFYGEIRDSDQLKMLYQQSKYLIVPSLAEGMPVVILEAMALGVPVIASNVGAIAELVIPGKTGWLVSPGDRQDLSSTMKKAMALPEKDYDIMSKECRSLIMKRFSYTVVCKRLKKLIHEIKGGAKISISHR